MKKLLTSDTLIKKLEELDFELGDAQIATLVITSYLPFDEKCDRLRRLMDSTDDRELVKLLQLKMREDQAEIDQISRNESGVVYSLRILSDGISREYTHGIYNEFSKAEAVGKSQGKDYVINRFGLNRGCTDVSGDLGYIRYNNHGQILQFCSYETDDEVDGLLDMCYQYVDLPMIFEIGNIVSVISTGEIGIVVEHTSDANNDRTKSIDDTRIAVICINGDGSFCKRKILPTYLEITDDMDYIDEIITILGVKRNKLCELVWPDDDE